MQQRCADKDATENVCKPMYTRNQSADYSDHNDNGTRDSQQRAECVLIHILIEKKYGAAHDHANQHSM